MKENMLSVLIVMNLINVRVALLQSNDVQICGTGINSEEIDSNMLTFVTMTGKSLFQGICFLYLVTDTKLAIRGKKKKKTEMQWNLEHLEDKLPFDGWRLPG